MKATNKEFSLENKPFIAACKKAGIAQNVRQASKYRMGKGLAYKNK